MSAVGAYPGYKLHTFVWKLPLALEMRLARANVNRFAHA